MKIVTRKSLGLMLAAVMLLAVMPVMAVPALADSSDTLYLAKDDTTVDKWSLYTMVDGDGKGAAEYTSDPSWEVSNDGANLTLDGFSFTTTAATALVVPDGTIIDVQGASSITSGDADDEDSTALYCDGELEITGTAGLTLTAGACSGEVPSGGGSRSAAGRGVYCDALTVSTELTANGGTGDEAASVGIDVSNLIIKTGADVTSSGGDRVSEPIGVMCDNLEVSGGMLKAIAGEGVYGSAGLVVKDTGSVSGGGKLIAETTAASATNTYAVMAATGLDATVMGKNAGPDLSEATFVTNTYQVTEDSEDVTATYIEATAPGLPALTVELTAGFGKVTLSAMTPEAGFGYMYYATSTPLTGKPVSGDDVDDLYDSPNWTDFSTAIAVDVPAGDKIHVYVVKYNTLDSSLVGWGSASETSKAFTDEKSSGLTNVKTFTLYNLIEEVKTDAVRPEKGDVLAIAKNTSRTLGYHPQDSGLVTVKLGKTVADPAPYVSSLTTKTGDTYYVIGGTSSGTTTAPDGIDIFSQSAAFNRLFDSCGGIFAFNGAEGNRYSCRGGAETNTTTFLYKYEEFELNSIAVTLASGVKYSAGSQAKKEDLGEVIGTYLNPENGKAVTAKLDIGVMVTGITFVHSDGTESNSYATGDKLKVTVKDANLSTAPAFTAVVDIVYSGSKSPGGGPEPDKAIVIVDGEEVSIGEVTVDKDTGVTITVVDQEGLAKQLETAHDNVTVIIPQAEGSTTAVVELVVKNIEDMAEKRMSFTVQTAGVEYSIPTNAVDSGALLEKLGLELNEADKAVFAVTISTSLSSEAQAAAETAIANADAGTIVIPPMEFRVTAAYGGKTVEAGEFSGYVSRTIEITAEQAAKITTATIIEPDGTVRHVPTRVFQKDGKWYAKINSLTNSVYVLIDNNKVFSDAAGEWFEDIVNEMGSRKIIEGIADGGDVLFKGQQSVTRAEFAAMTVRALGLPENGDGSVFSDVKYGDWYYGAVGTAYKYGIVEGVGGGEYRPTANITRQEAMVIIRRAAKIAQFDGRSGDLSAFFDVDSISGWARDAAEFNVGSGLIVGFGGRLNPRADITRAETATVILRLLQKAELVDMRSAA